MLTIKIIMWTIVTIGCVGLLLICLANKIESEALQTEWDLDDAQQGMVPLVPTPPVNPGRQIEVLSKFTIGKPDFKQGEQVLFLDVINGKRLTK
jgi:hypothetical protein